MTSLRLRRLRDADLDVLFEQQKDLEAVRMAAFTKEDPADREAYDAHWKRIRADGEIVIRAVAEGEVVLGSILSFVMDGRREVSYWIGREHWGRGVASRALALFLDVVTERPLYARAAADNVGSLRVLEKCGFGVVGEERGFANARGEEIDEYVLRLDGSA